MKPLYTVPIFLLSCTLLPLKNITGFTSRIYLQRWVLCPCKIWASYGGCCVEKILAPKSKYIDTSKPGSKKLSWFQTLQIFNMFTSSNSILQIRVGHRYHGIDYEHENMKRIYEETLARRRAYLVYKGKSRIFSMGLPKGPMPNFVKDQCLVTSYKSNNPSFFKEIMHFHMS